MKILIAGATGLIGQALVSALKVQHEIGIVGRSRQKIDCVFSSVSHLTYDWEQIKKNGADILAGYDVVINLAGENIGAKRWSDQQKIKITNSRVDATSLIAEKAIAANNAKLRLLNASAIGIYGFAGDTNQQMKTVFDEHTQLTGESTCFLSKVGHVWEQALVPAEQAGLAVTKMRFGVVLSKQGGALKKMLPPFRLGAGAVLGSGEQPFSWIAISDLVRAIVFLINHPDITGPINLVAPEVVSQRLFAKTLAAALHRPCWMVMPAPVVKFLFGQMGVELLLRGQHVSCQHLLDQGFQFKVPELGSAFRTIFS